MLKHLDSEAIYALTRLFNLCLRNGKWLWNSSNIVFLKKKGKDSYSKPGSYRPISISSYIGKLFEKILVRRLDQYLLKVGIIDANQEGFSKGWSTVRYLHRLAASIKGDMRKRLTVLCLFVDFEKAFDSVWKKGFIVKLWKVGVHGCYLKTINSFLMNRTVCLLLNGYVGPVRKCLDFGLPQGAVLSPILFKFYVYDLDNICQLYHQISFFKFADDGSAKVTGETLEECLYYMNLVLGSINDWTSRWRMVINCNVNKTEVICFHSNTPQLVPTSFTLGNKTSQLTDHSKVLGAILDKNLTYKEHSSYVYNKLIYRWVNICRYCNRNWGLNQIVTIRLIRVLIFSSLFYGSIVWMNSGNMKAINSLWYKLSKSAVRSIFNVSSSLLEVILDTPPLEIQDRIIIVKHYLKCVTNQHDSHQDKHLSFILDELADRNSAVENHIGKVFKFLAWKIKIRPEVFSGYDQYIVEKNMFDLFPSLSKKACLYSKELMKKYSEYLWDITLKRQLQLDGQTRIPKISCDPIEIGTSREEVEFISMFYKNSLLNGFLFTVEREKYPSPLCECQLDDQTAFHILTSCEKVDADIREDIILMLLLGNDIASADALAADNISLLNCSRDELFVQHCLKALKTSSLQLRTRITLFKKAQISGQPKP